MANDQEKIEREKRAERLRWARKQSEFKKGPKAVASALGMSVNTYKAYEQGRNGFGLVDAKRFARLFNVSVLWLNFGTGSPEDEDIPDKAERLQSMFNRLAEAPELVQDQVLSYAEFALDTYERTKDTTAIPAS